MHPYATDSDRGRMTLLVLAVLSIVAAWGLGATFHTVGFRPPWWLDTPAVIGVYGVLWRLYDGTAWHWSLGRLRVSDVPNLGGMWTGELESSYGEGESQPTTIPVTMTIRQTASRMLMVLEAAGSRSTSISASLNCKPGPFDGLSYLYENRPNALSAPTMTPHGGRCHLRLSRDGQTLDGEYEGDRYRHNFGRVRLTRTG